MGGRTGKVEVVLSYSAASEDIAKELSRALPKRGVTTWSDVEHVAAGQNFREEIERALRRARGVVFLIDSGWKRQPRLQNYWSTVLEGTWENPRKRLIPVLIEDAEAPAFLRDRAAIHVRKRDADLDSIARRILTALVVAKPLTSRSARARQKARWRERMREMRTEVAALWG
jgi:hypothetical protein